MSPIYDFACSHCQLELMELRKLHERNHEKVCPSCKEPMKRLLPQRVHTTSWGGPRYITSLDQTFESRSDLERFKKACAWEDAGDRVGGARNEDGFKGRITVDLTR